MHVLLTADTVGGVWTYTRELVTGLTRGGIKVTLVSFGGLPSPQQTCWMDGLPGLDYRPTAFKLEWMQDAEAEVEASAEYLEEVIGETGPDLLHLSQFYYGALESPVPRIVVAHSDVVSWWLAVHCEEPPDSAWLRWYRKVVKRGLSGATQVVAPSRWMLDQICLHYTKPQNASVVYNGRTAEIFNPYFAKEDLMVSVGRQWDQGKNAELLLKRQLPFFICMVGPDRHPESQGRAFGAEQPRAGVRFESQQTERQLSRLLAKASIYAATSCYEPFGLALVEAAFSRCAIVASDIPTFRELWDEAAIFFRNDDAESLAETLEQMLRHRGLIRSYGNLALHRAQQRFSAAAMVANYIDLYRSLAGAKALAG